jgi:hypothetical protein
MQIGSSGRCQKRSLTLMPARAIALGQARPLGQQQRSIATRMLGQRETPMSDMPPQITILSMHHL